MSAWVQATTIKQFFLQHDIAADIKLCHQAIDAFLQDFNITSQMEMHTWMAKFESNRERDQTENVRFLSDLKNQQMLMSEAMRGQHEEVIGFMSNLQEVRTLVALF